MFRKLHEDFPTKPKRPFQQSPTQSTATVPLAYPPRMENLTQLQVQEYSTFLAKDRPNNLITSRVIASVVGCEDLISRFEVQTRWMAYELERHVVVLVGPVCLNIELGVEVAVYFPENYKMLVEGVTGKPAIKVERKLTSEGLYLMGYPYLIYEPSDLAYPTLICQWISCYRRNTLKGYFGKGGHNEESLVLGNVGHSILEGMGLGSFSEMTFEEVLIFIYQQYLHDLFLINMPYETFKEKCTRKFTNLWDWFETHVRNKQPMRLEGDIECTVDKLIGSEVKIKSKIFGLKGVIDMLMECTIKRNGKTFQGIVPFELKTADNQKDYHVFQVDLYNLMLCQKFGGESIGIVYYPTVNRMVPVITSPLTIYQLLIRRNEVIRNNKLLFEGNHLRLPYFSLTGESCGKCEYNKQCIGTFIARKPYCASTQDTLLQDLQDLQQQQQVPVFSNPNLKNLLTRLSPLDRQYMKKWLWMLHLQDKSHRQDTRSFIRMGLNVMIVENFGEVCRELQNTLKEKNQGHVKLLMRNRGFTANKMQDQKHGTTEAQQRDLLEGYWRKGERVLVNINMIKLSERGEICSIERNTEGVTLEIKLINKQPSFRDQLLECVALLDCKAELEKYDKGPFGELRSTVVSLACSDSERDKVKQIVIGGRKPTFRLGNQRFVQYFKENVQPSEYLNVDQKEAIRKALCMDKFSLIEGMPGTGKTQVIARLIEILYQLNLKVLVTSYTNCSLDTVLSRVIKQTSLPRPALIRDGSHSARSSNFQDLTYRRESFTSIEEINEFFQQKRVWFVTLSSLSLEHIPSDFDVVIVDEASQCLEPLCVSAIYKARKFVLIGDYRQLQPLVKNQQARQSGMAISLFERLCVLYSELTTPLKKQFRMCQQIMALSNELVYDNLLEPANPQTCCRRLCMTPPSPPIPISIWPILSPSSPIVFLDLDSLPKITPSTEQSIVLNLYECFRRLSVARQDISIISFYNQTTNQLVEKLKEVKLIETNDGDVLTVDKSQGIDKECIIFLAQKGPDHNKLIGDIRRINVSLTRAKSKLVIVASRLHAQQVLGGKLVELLDKNRLAINEEMLDIITEPY